jgi:VCBS repeat-containing protein
MTLGTPITVFPGTLSALGGFTWEQAYDAQPEIARAPDGSFAVSWSYSDVSWSLQALPAPPGGTPTSAPMPHIGAHHTVVEQFDANGQPIGSPLELPARTYAPAVGFDGNGDLAVSYFNQGSSGGISGISVQLLNSSGQPRGTPVTIFPGTLSALGGFTWEQAYDAQPEIARAPDGSFAVSWSYSDVSWSLQALPTPPGGTPTSAPVPHVGAHHTVVKQFDANGQPEDPLPELPADTYAPAVAFDGNGDLAVAYFNRTAGGSTSGISAQLSGSLFTTKSNRVDFNDLRNAQKQAIAGGADLYHSLAGDDTVTLPDKDHYLLIPLVDWNPDERFCADSGNDTFDYQKHELTGYANTVQKIDGGANDRNVGSANKGLDLIKLPGSPDHYAFEVTFDADASRTRTEIRPTDAVVTFDTLNIEEAQFANTSTNDVNLTSGSVAVEMLQLASEAYGPQRTLEHRAEPLAWQQPGASPEFSESVSLRAQDRNWHAVAAMELGMAPADFGQFGPLQYSFVGGHYQAINTSRFFINGDQPEANALVLSGLLHNNATNSDVNTVAVVFRGTDQIADLRDYLNFREHYNDFRPLVDALRDYIDDPHNHIQQVLVSGHSLGAGMVQYFMSEFSNDSRFHAFTDGSPGSDDQLPTNDNRIVNFVHTDDAVGNVPYLFDPTTPQPVHDNIESSLLSYLPQSLIDSLLPKHRNGADLLINSEISNSINLDEHDRNSYTADVKKLLHLASDKASPFFGGSLFNLASCLQQGAPYSGPSVQLALGTDAGNEIHSLPNDNYVIAGGGNDDILLGIRGSFLASGNRQIDGGLGIDTVWIPWFSSDFQGEFNGTAYTITYTDPVLHTVSLVATLYRVEQIFYFDKHLAVDGSLSGSVGDGYLSGATVFSDANGNGQLDPGEASTTTDADGKFTLTGGTGPLIAFGGTDISTGLGFSGRLSAPAGSAAVTPLTTLVTVFQQQGIIDVDQAQQAALRGLGLDANLDLTTFDPIAATQGGDAAGAAAYVAGAKVIDTIIAIATALAGLGGDAAAAQHDAFAALAGAINNLNPGETLDLADPATIAALFAGAADDQGIDVGQFSDAVAAAIAASNAALDQQLETNPSGEALLSGVSAVQLVTQGNHAPTASDDAATATIGSSISEDAAHGVLANDTDPDGDTLSVTGFSAGTYGKLILNSDGSYHYTVTDLSGPTGSHLHDVFTYGISDGRGGVASANLDITLDRIPSTDSDFDGDHFGDLFLFTDSGANAIWLMNQNVRQGAGTNLHNTDPSWHMKAAVDFDPAGPGFADLLWQNDNGAVAIWQMQGTTVINQTDLPNPGATWHVAAAKDFDGNTGADILYQNDNGQLAIWTMQDSSHILSQFNIDQNPGVTWHARGAGDFNGDGKAGVLFQNDNGALAIWENLQNTGGVGHFQLQADLPRVDPTWHVKAVEDFDGDGKADILFQNDSGAAAIWLMDGTQIKNGGSSQFNIAGTAGPGPTWHIVGARDMNADGHADILWQNDNGAAAVWENFTPGPGAQVATFTTQLDFNPQPNPSGHLDWHIV